MAAHAHAESYVRTSAYERAHDYVESRMEDGVNAEVLTVGGVDSTLVRTRVLSLRDVRRERAKEGIDEGRGKGDTREQGIGSAKEKAQVKA